MVVREHDVSYRNGPQVMVAGLKLRDMGYRRGASVTVSDPTGHQEHVPWQFVVSNAEHATLVSVHPPPPAWIQPGVRVRIEVVPPVGDVVRPKEASRDVPSEGSLPPKDSALPAPDRSTEGMAWSEEPRFRGNLGNLLQHWVLCEVLSACQNQYQRLGFIDGYSMAPFARNRPVRDDTAALFDQVARRLPGEQSLYERAWLRLTPNTDEYPNSAAFLTVVWRGRYAMLLCESHSRTAERLEQWAAVARQFPGCEGIEVAAGNWREHLRGPLLTSADLHYFSFDPYMFDRHGAGQRLGNMHPADLDLLVGIVDRISGGVVVQLSTYSANNHNAQPDVRQVVVSRLAKAGLQEVALVRADEKMMSLVFMRNVQAADVVQALPLRFEAWLRRFK